MKPVCSLCQTLKALVLASLLLACQLAFSQSPDSSRQIRTAALQFQLINGFGLNYWSGLPSGSYLRVGADLSYHHSNSSGMSGGDYTYSSVSDTYSSSTHETSSGTPDDNSTSYQISISGVYLRSIPCFVNTSIFCGGGLGIQHSKGWSSSSSSTVRWDTSFRTVQTSENRNNSRSVGVGPVLVCEVQTSLISHVALSAEVSLSAMYQWSWTDSYWSYGNTSTGSSHSSSSNSQSQNTNEKGWDISLNSIRLGIVVEL